MTIRLAWLWLRRRWLWLVGAVLGIVLLLGVRHRRPATLARQLHEVDAEEQLARRRLRAEYEAEVRRARLAYAERVELEDAREADAKAALLESPDELLLYWRERARELGE